MNINIKVKGGNSFFSHRAHCPYSLLLLAGDRCQQWRQIQPVHQDQGVAYDGGSHGGGAWTFNVKNGNMKEREVLHSKYEVWYRFIHTS